MIVDDFNNKGNKNEKINYLRTCLKSFNLFKNILDWL